MAFNLRPFGKIINVLMYNDICTIYREKQTTDQYGASKPNSKEEVYKDIKCKFSFLEKDSPSDSNGAFMPVLKQVVIFLDLDYEILPGDFITGYRIDNTTGIKQLVQGKCGKPNRYETHQEISIQFEGEN